MAMLEQAQSLRQLLQASRLFLKILGSQSFLTSTMVSGRLYGASHLAPTPAWLDAVVLDMEAAYN